MRAFFCIELEDELKGKLDAITQALKRRCAARVSWVRQENLHITLKFLGEIAPEQVGPLRAAAEQVVDGLEPFEILLDRLGAFPELARPRVIWVGSSSPPPQIQKLHEALERELEGLGFPREGKPYTPHVTLGRVKERPGAGAAVAELAERLRAVEPFQFSARASGLTLMESQLAPQGSIYRPIFRLEFSIK